MLCRVSHSRQHTSYDPVMATIHLRLSVLQKPMNVESTLPTRTLPRYTRPTSNKAETRPEVCWNGFYNKRIR